jgi:predicted CxxxxCH...CXXCH cytochrome family protein
MQLNCAELALLQGLELAAAQLAHWFQASQATDVVSRLRTAACHSDGAAAAFALVTHASWTLACPARLFLCC